MFGIGRHIDVIDVFRQAEILKAIISDAVHIKETGQFLNLVCRQLVIRRKNDCAAVFNGKVQFGSAQIFYGQTQLVVFAHTKIGYVGFFPFTANLLIHTAAFGIFVKRIKKHKLFF